MLIATLLERIPTGKGRLLVLGAVLILLPGIVAVPSARADAPSAHFSYRSSNCAYPTYADPLDVRWFNIDWLSVKVGLEQYMAPWGTLLEDPFGSSSQYAYDAGTCEPANYSAGRQWGQVVYAPLNLKKYKFHARLFTTGSGQVAADAHLERKRRDGTCSNTAIGWNDAVYRRYNGQSGFDAAMQKIVAGYRAHSSSTISVVKSRTPFTHLFKQCTGEIVHWSGRVAYITRTGP